MAQNQLTNRQAKYQQQQQSLNPNELINKICCTIINQLLQSLNCKFYIENLLELSNGIILAELIDQFEELVVLKSKNFIKNEDQRKPFRKLPQINYVDYIEKWLNIQNNGSMDVKSTIHKLFDAINESEMKMKSVFYDSNNNEIIHDSLIIEQQNILYDRSITYISLLCYQIIKIFLRYENILKLSILNYNFKIDYNDLTNIFFFTRWKLTEEELLIKDAENMRLKDKCDQYEIQINQLKNQLQLQQHSTQNQFAPPHQQYPRQQQTKYLDQNSTTSSLPSSSIMIPTMIDSSTITNIYGHLNRPVKIDFDYNTNHLDANVMSFNTKNTIDTVDGIDCLNKNKQPKAESEILNKVPNLNDEKIQIPIGSYRNLIEIRKNPMEIDSTKTLKTFEKSNILLNKQTLLNVDDEKRRQHLQQHQEHQHQQQQRQHQTDIKQNINHLSQSSSSTSNKSCIIDRNSLNFDKNKTNVDKALKYGQNSIKINENDDNDDGSENNEIEIRDRNRNDFRFTNVISNTIEKNNDHNNDYYRMMMTTGNRNNNHNQNEKLTSLLNNLNQTELVKYLARIPSADMNKLSAIKSYDFKYNHHQLNNDNRNNNCNDNQQKQNENNKQSSSSPSSSSLSSTITKNKNNFDMAEHNKILVQRLLAELAYERSKPMKQYTSTMMAIDKNNHGNNGMNGKNNDNNDDCDNGENYTIF